VEEDEENVVLEFPEIPTQDPKIPLETKSVKVRESKKEEPLLA
jgi:hypothetical protein